MDSEQPLVSICIPVFNRDKMVSRAIESALHQSYRNIEIVVVDNASTDRSWEVISAYGRRNPRVKAFRNENNIGGGKNFLKCAEYASGFYAQALGSDDWLSENYVEEGLKTFASNPDIAAVLSNIISFELKKDNVQLSFLDEVLIGSGMYPSDWFFRNIYLGKSGGAGFISFMRRKDFILALKKVMDNPVNMFWRGDRYEPFDMPVFLEVLAKYERFFVTKNSAYIKTVHGKDHVGLEGDSFGSREGLIHYALAIRRAFESFYSEHGFKRHFSRLRFFGGSSIAANSFLAFFKSWPEKEAKDKYFSAVRNYFADYSKKEKWLIMIGIVPYVFSKVMTRFGNLFTRKQSFAPNENYFLSSTFEFEI